MKSILKRQKPMECQYIISALKNPVKFRGRFINILRQKKTVDISKAPLKTDMHDRISVLRGFIIAIETGYDTMFT